MGLITSIENTIMKKFPQQPLMTCDEGLIGCVQERNTLHLQCNALQYSEIQCTPELWNWIFLFSNIIQHSCFIVEYSALKNLKAVKKTLLPIRTQQFTHQPCKSAECLWFRGGTKKSLPTKRSKSHAHTHCPTYDEQWRILYFSTLLSKSLSTKLS